VVFLVLFPLYCRYSRAILALFKAFWLYSVILGIQLMFWLDLGGIQRGLSDGLSAVGGVTHVMRACLADINFVASQGNGRVLHHWV